MLLPPELDMPHAEVMEVASILAKGYLRYRASLRAAVRNQRNQRQDLAQKNQTRQTRQPQHHPEHDTQHVEQPAANTGLAFPAPPSVHVTVVNAQRKGEKGKRR